MQTTAELVTAGLIVPGDLKVFPRMVDAEDYLPIMPGTMVNLEGAYWEVLAERNPLPFIGINSRTGAPARIMISEVDVRMLRASAA